MAIYNIENEKSGAVLPYIKIAYVSFRKLDAEVMISESKSGDLKPLTGCVINMNLKQKEELSDILLSSTYEYMKSKGLITGDDC